MRRISKHRFFNRLNACFTISIFALISPLPSLAGDWKLEQKHYISGDHILYISPNAIRIVNRTAGYEVISAAPEWHVKSFRRDDKVMRDLSRDEYYKTNEFFPRMSASVMSRTAKVGSRSVGGLATEIFRKGQNEYCLIKLPGIGKPIEDLLLSYYRVEPVKGFLVNFTTNGQPRESANAIFEPVQNAQARLTVMETIRSKEIALNTSDFAAPVGYRMVSNLDEIRTSAERRNQASSIFSDLGLGEKLGTGKKQK